MSFCPRCGAKVETSDRYCQECSSALARPSAAAAAADDGRGNADAPPAAQGPHAPASGRCPSCGTDNKAVAKFCRRCGKPLGAVEQDDDRTVIAVPPSATTVDETTIIQAAAVRPDKWNVSGALPPQSPPHEARTASAPARSGRSVWIAFSLVGLAALAAGIYFVWSAMGRDTSPGVPAEALPPPQTGAPSAPPPAALVPPERREEPVAAPAHAPSAAQAPATPAPSAAPQAAARQESAPPVAAGTSAAPATAMPADAPRLGAAPPAPAGRGAEARIERERAADRKAERDKAAAREKAQRDKAAEQERAAARAETARREAAERQQAAAAERERQAEAAPMRPAAQPSPDATRWGRMRQELQACGEGFGAFFCKERVRWRFCDGYWDKVPECPQGARN
jgi:hypothetical protein